MNRLGDMLTERERNRYVTRLEAEAERDLARVKAARLEVGADEQEAKQDCIDRLTAALTPFTDAELEAAKEPHPHAFMDGTCGMFPVGEVTVLAAPGREGKTFAVIGMAASYVTGLEVGGMKSEPGKRVLIYSAEDDRQQYARKVLAVASRLGREDAEKIRDKIIVPDLMAEGMEPFVTLVQVSERQPAAAPVIEDIADALQGLNIGLLVFETASTLSEAEEDNRAFRIIIRALRKIARKTACAVLLVHHTSQAAAQVLPDLKISTADVRGATSLVFNARQVAMLVNLGSETDPFADNDARTIMRRMLFPNRRERIAAWITLDTSKAANPPPVFFRWELTEYGPALYVVPCERGAGSWRKLHMQVMAGRAKERETRKAEERASKTAVVLDAVGQLIADDKPPTVRAVSIACKRSAEWAKPYLEAAVESGDLTCKAENVPRTAGKVNVYRLADSSDSAPQTDGSR